MRIVVGAVLVRDGRVLAARRAHPPELAGRWELPGGAVEPGEDEPTALRRECREELGIDAVVGERFGPDVAVGPDRVLRCYVCTTGDEPVAHEHAALRWVASEELGALDWLPADRVLLDGMTDGADGTDVAAELRRRAPS